MLLPKSALYSLHAATFDCYLSLCMLAALAPLPRTEIKGTNLILKLCVNGFNVYRNELASYMRCTDGPVTQNHRIENG